MHVILTLTLIQVSDCAKKMLQVWTSPEHRKAKMDIFGILTKVSLGIQRSQQPPFKGQNRSLWASYKGQERFLWASYKGQERFLWVFYKGQDRFLWASYKGQNKSLLFGSSPLLSSCNRRLLSGLLSPGLPWARCETYWNKTIVNSIYI